jgi:hypothetical protein
VGVGGLGVGVWCWCWPFLQGHLACVIARCVVEVLWQSSCTTLQTSKMPTRAVPAKTNQPALANHWRMMSLNALWATPQVQPTNHQHPHPRCSHPNLSLSSSMWQVHAFRLTHLCNSLSQQNAVLCSAVVLCVRVNVRLCPNPSIIIVVVNIGAPSFYGSLTETYHARESIYRTWHALHLTAW